MSRRVKSWYERRLEELRLREEVIRQEHESKWLAAVPEPFKFEELEQCMYEACVSVGKLQLYFQCDANSFDHLSLVTSPIIYDALFDIVMQRHDAAEAIGGEASIRCRRDLDWFCSNYYPLGGKSTNGQRWANKMFYRIVARLREHFTTAVKELSDGGHDCE